jgi:hypothetical protein
VSICPPQADDQLPCSSLVAFHFKFVSLNCFEQVFVRFAFHYFSTNQFFYRVLTHFRQFHRFSHANCANFICYRRVGNYFFRSPVLGSLELRHADIFAFLPLAIRFFAHIAKLSGSDMRTL